MSSEYYDSLQTSQKLSDYNTFANVDQNIVNESFMYQNVPIRILATQNSKESIQSTHNSMETLDNVKKEMKYHLKFILDCSEEGRDIPIQTKSYFNVKFGPIFNSLCLTPSGIEIVDNLMKKYSDRLSKNKETYINSIEEHIAALIIEIDEEDFMNEQSIDIDTLGKFSKQQLKDINQINHLSFKKGQTKFFNMFVGLVWTKLLQNQVNSNEFEKWMKNTNKTYTNDDLSIEKEVDGIDLLMEDINFHMDDEESSMDRQKTIFDKEEELANFNESQKKKSLTNNLKMVRIDNKFIINGREISRIGETKSDERIQKLIYESNLIDLQIKDIFKLSISIPLQQQKQFVDYIKQEATNQGYQVLKISNEQVKLDTAKLHATMSNNICLKLILQQNSGFIELQILDPVILQYKKQERVINNFQILAKTQKEQLVKSMNSKWQLKISLEEHKDAIRCIALSRDNKWLASGGNDNIIQIQNMKTYKVEHYLTHHSWQVWCLEFSHDSVLLASGGHDKLVALQNADNGQVIHRFLDCEKEVRCLRFTQDDRQLCCGDDSFKIQIFDIKLKQLYKKLENIHIDQVMDLSITTNNRYLASCSQDKTVQVQDFQLNRVVEVLKNHNSGVRAVKFSQIGRYLVSACRQGKVLIYSYSNEQDASRKVYIRFSMQRENIHMNIEVRSVEFMGDESLAIARNDGKVVFWDYKKDVKQAEQEYHSGPVTSVCISNDFKTFLSCGEDKLIQVFKKL